MTQIIPGMVLRPLSDREPGAPEPLLEEPYLVLYVNTSLDVVMMIAITARHRSGRYYYREPKRFQLSRVESQLDLVTPTLVSQPLGLRPATNWTDEEIDQRYRRGAQEESAPLRRLKLNWRLIEPLVTTEDQALLFDRESRATLIKRRAAEALKDPALALAYCGDIRRVAKAIQRALFQYWACGSIRGALIGFGDACGAPGKPRKSGPRKRGRPNAAIREGIGTDPGLNVEHGSKDAKIIQHCHSTWVVRGRTVGSACRRMWSEFYSIQVQRQDGSIATEFLPESQRPTEAQFRYWGTKEDPSEVAWRKQLPPNKFSQSYRAVQGAVTSDVVAVGQRGAIDSTTLDLQLVRAVDRVDRVGGAYRILVVDGMFGYIAGVYIGFDPPSSNTVRLALYNALDPDKRSWLDGLGLDLPAEHFIPIWFANLWADNTDARSEDIKECALQINTAIHFIPKNRPDLNSRAESGHHSLHSAVDHNLAGTTFGRKKARGEESATIQARHTLFEAIRENVRAIHYHNTVEIEDNRTLKMRRSNVPPTRYHMTKELIRQGQIARSALPVDFARCHLLPRLGGTFTPGGVRLHRTAEGGKPEFIRHLAYVSDHPIVVRWCEEARRHVKDDPSFFRSEFIVDPSRLLRIWHVDRNTGEIIELSLRTPGIHDPDLPYEMTFWDALDRDHLEAAEAIRLKRSMDQKRADLEAGQRVSNEQANQLYDEALARRGKRPSRKDMQSSKRANREAELGDAVFGMPIPFTSGDVPTQISQEGDAVSPSNVVNSSPATDLTSGSGRASSESSQAASAPGPRRKNRLLRGVIHRVGKEKG